MSSSSSKSAFETSHFISRRKEGQRANTPGFLSRPLSTRSTPFLTAETLVRRDSSNSFLLLLLLFLCPEGGVFGGPFQSRRLRCRRCLSLCKISLFPGKRRYDDVDVDGGNADDLEDNCDVNDLSTWKSASDNNSHEEGVHGDNNDDAVGDEHSVVGTPASRASPQCAASRRARAAFSERVCQRGVPLSEPHQGDGRGLMLT